MSEEEKKAIEIVMDFAITHINDFESEEDFKYVDIAKKVIENQKAEIEKKDKMIDLMAKVIVNLDDQLVINHYENKQQCIEFFKELVEGEKKDGRE